MNRRYTAAMLCGLSIGIVSGGIASAQHQGQDQDDSSVAPHVERPVAARAAVTLPDNVTVIDGAGNVLNAEARGLADPITYQGRLHSGGLPANGNYSMTFRVYNSSVAGTLLGTIVNSAVQVTDGVFTQNLSFGPTVFDGSDRYIEIQVGATTLSPRQMVTPAPYALKANSLQWPVVDTHNGPLLDLSNTATFSDYPAIYGRSASRSNFTSAIVGEMTSTNGDAGSCGVRGISNSTSGYGIGVWGSHPGFGDGYGVYGTTNNGSAVIAANTSANGHLFRGFQSGTVFDIGGFNFEGGNQGLYINESQSTDAHSYAIYARQSAAGTNDTPAIYGVNNDDDFYGVGVQGEGGYRGVRGNAYGTGNKSYYGVYGYASAGAGGAAYGVFGAASGGSNTWAGYFNGNVNVIGTLSKGGGSFKIDHPLDPYNKFLYHSFVESPEMMNIYNGNAIFNAAGQARIVMPDYFEALNRDFRYQLTAVGAPMPNLYVASKMSNGSFVIAGGVPSAEVSWQVTGVRQDAFANENRIPVEEFKQGREVGKLLHPTAFGRAEEEGIDRSRELEEAAKGGR